MKRKLDEDYTPVSTEGSVPAQAKGSFDTLNLDPRLLQALIKERYSKPTPVQAQAIPLALNGKDILARAKTGSGKTAAYLLPILQSLLRAKSINPTSRTSALILVPTRELAEQVVKATTSLTAFCANDIRSINLTHKVSDAVQRSLLADSPDVVVATPARALANINSGSLSLEHLTHLVIDEADLVFSYGYDDDLQQVAKSIPKGVQTFLMSATLSSEVDTLKGLFCRDPIVLELDEKEDPGSGISQYVVRCGEDEKFLLIYVIFKLKLIKGKCIVFVEDIDRCYRLKLYLEQFGIRSCVLNSELPVNSRIHVVEEFNKNVYEIIIASDEHEVLGAKAKTKKRQRKAAEDAAERSETAADRKDVEDDNDDDDDVAPSKPAPELSEPSRKKRKPDRRDKEYGISRGIDFKNVSCVLNFDLPTSSTSYTHRIGRTGRAGQTGMAVSFVVPRSQYRKHKSTSVPSAKHDEDVLDEIIRHQAQRRGGGGGAEVRPYAFDMKQVEAFRYRMDDALRAVTRLAIRQARTREIRAELLKSDKLKRHFEENPDHLRHLRHDTESRAVKVQPHLKHVPEYLLPAGDGARAGLVAGAGPGAGGEGKAAFVSVGKGGEDGRRHRGGSRRGRSVRGRGGAFGGGAGRRLDPLKSFRGRR